ncbi:hypothetical protein OTU49_006792 [Cherax quadricarinatus]|uniref:Uncharacterized protein n=1 Tax=Cherax quadricarinatus TaxID=27406 RepID=A0AAW0WYG7_CHEQU
MLMSFHNYWYSSGAPMFFPPSEIDWARRLEVIVQGRLVWAWVVSSAPWMCSPSYHQTIYTTCVTWPLPSATRLPKSPHAYLQSPTLFPLPYSLLYHLGFRVMAGAWGLEFNQGQSGDPRLPRYGQC